MKVILWTFHCGYKDIVMIIISILKLGSIVHDGIVVWILTYCLLLDLPYQSFKWSGMVVLGGERCFNLAFCCTLIELMIKPTEA